MNGGEGDDEIISDEDDTITGGAGADTVVMDDGGDQTLIYNAITDSNASLSVDVIVGNVQATDEVDITAIANQLAGSVADTVNAPGGVDFSVTGAADWDAVEETLTIESFADFREVFDELSGGMVESENGQIEAYILADVDDIVDEDGDAVFEGSDGTLVTHLVVLNDTNTILSGGDFMVGFDNLTAAESFIDLAEDGLA